MKGLYRKFNLFCLRNRNKGIPNLMLLIAAGNALVYILTLFDPSMLLYKWLYFSKELILQGQVWRLITFVITPTIYYDAFGHLIALAMFYFFYRIGLSVESRIGTCKFNLFYLVGILFLAAAGMLYPGQLFFNGDSLHMSLVLAFAVMYADAQILLMYIIPIKAKYLAWFYLGYTALQCVLSRSLLPLIPIANYFLFFWSDFSNLLPDGARIRSAKKQRSPFRQPKHTPKQQGRPNPNWAEGYQSKTGQKPYRHKCTVCGRTDTEHPSLEFRYCSRCEGYHCYCLDHINDHPHITE